MTHIVQSFSKPSIKVCRDVGLVNFSLIHSISSVIVTPASTTPVVRGDSNYNESTPSVIYSGGRILVNNIVGNGVFNSLTPQIATIDQDGNISRVSEGVANFSFTAKGVTKNIFVDLNNKAGSDPVYEFVSIVSGTIANHLSQQVDNRIDNTMTKAANAGLFDVMNHSAPSYTRNTDFWASDVDLTSISPWNSNAGKNKAGVLVTPRHVLNAAHYDYPVGTIIRFIKSDNTVVDKTVIARQRQPYYGTSQTHPDFTIYTLDSDVPSGINFAKVLPSNYSNYISTDNVSDTRIPAMGLDAEEKGTIRDISRITTEAWFQEPSDSDRSNLYESIIVGDSGNPVFAILNGELVLLTVWTSGGPGMGSLIASYISIINQMIVDSDTSAGVSTGYSLTQADFSSFPTI